MVARAKQQRLAQAARMEQAIGEDVTALAVGSELNLVDGDEVRLEVERHRLDGAHVIFRLRRLDLLFAGDERDLVGADAVATILS